MLRKREFRWTEIEELSWQLLKNVSTLNLNQDGSGQKQPTKLCRPFYTQHY